MQCSCNMFNPHFALVSLKLNFIAIHTFVLDFFLAQTWVDIFGFPCLPTIRPYCNASLREPRNKHYAPFLWFSPFVLLLPSFLSTCIPPICDTVKCYSEVLQYTARTALPFNKLHHNTQLMTD